MCLYYHNQPQMSIYYNMKSLFSVLVLFLALQLVSAEPVMTNGVFYANAPVECHLIAQDGSSVTNQLAAGRTYMVGNALAEMDVTNVTDFYLAGVGLVEAGTNSVFSLNLFDQEVANLEDTPCKAQFGTHNVSVMLNNGDFSIIYPGDTNSSFTVSTPLTSYELGGGKYFFRVSDKSVVAYVIEGTMQVHGDGKKVDKTDKGKLALAIPFTDPASGVSDKVISNIKAVAPEDSGRFTTPAAAAEKKWSDVQFFIVNGRVLGIRMR